MAEPFLSEIRIFSFNFAPQGWAFCNGQQLPINQNSALFSLMGTTYGGDGISIFALPNLQGRVAVHQGNQYIMGELGGEANHTLTTSEIPVHSHSLAVAGTAATTANPVGGVFAIPGVNARLGLMYSTTGGSTAAADTIQPTGSSQPHSNMQPYLALNFCIALQGIFPSQN